MTHPFFLFVKDVRMALKPAKRTSLTVQTGLKLSGSRPAQFKACQTVRKDQRASAATMYNSDTKPQNFYRHSW